MNDSIWKPHVTVAAVIEQAGSFLCVEETIDGHRRLNQPAGHLEPGETLLAAVTREVLEETRHDFTSTGIIGTYLWRASPAGSTFLRIAFCGELGAEQTQLTLDPDIDAITWLSKADLDARQDEWRSPLVGRCVDDYVAGKRFPLESLINLLDVPG